MIKRKGLLRLLFAVFLPAKLTGAIPLSRIDRMIFRVLALCAFLVLAALSIGAYNRIFSEPVEFQDTAAVPDTQAMLPQTENFAQLAQTDPVAMLEKCLIRYQREVAGGCRCILEKEERIKGKLAPREVIDLFVRGDVPDANGKTHIDVLMKWQSGFQVVMRSELKSVLYREDKSKDTMTTWRPDAPLFKVSPVGVMDGSARNASRYCVRDAGLYRSMQRTYGVWKQRKEQGLLATEYLGLKPVEQLHGAECYHVKRLCPSPEVDPFELNGKPDLSPETVARDGFSELTIMVDAKSWLQAGTELRRANGELVAAYYFRDVELNPPFASNTFDEKDGLMKK